MSFIKPASEIWRDYITDGVPSSGAWKPDKADIRGWTLGVEETLGVSDTYPTPVWTTATAYTVGDRVSRGPGHYYTCTVAHTSGASTQPGVGGSWMTVWELFEAPFWVNDGSGVVIFRFADRLFVGEAVNATGNDPFAIQASILSTDAEGANWALRDSQLLSIASTGLIGVTGVSRASDQNLAPTEAIGVAGFVIHDKADAFSWALYGDVQHEAIANQSSYGLELAVKNKGANRTLNPYTSDVVGTYGIWLAGGGDSSYGGSPANPSMVGVTIGGTSGSTWNTGIVIRANGITGTDGVTGSGEAICMARGHQINWKFTGGNRGASIRSDVDAAGSDVTLLFGNKQALFLNDDGVIFTSLRYVDNSVNFVEMLGSVTGVGATVQAAGNDTNVDLRLRGKGTGVLDGTWHVLAASAVAASNTGNTTETPLATITVPAGAMGANGTLRITTQWAVTNNANAKTGRVRLGGISGTNYGLDAMANVASNRYQTIIANRNAANSQVGPVSGGGNGGWGTSTGAPATGAINTANAQDIVITGQLGNGADTITLEWYMVELLKRAYPGLCSAKTV